MLPSISIWDVLTSGRCLWGWGRRQEQTGMHQLFLPFLYHVINGRSFFHFLESKGMLWAGWQPHLSVDELVIACCPLWLVSFRRGSPSILTTALSLQIYSQKRKNRKSPYTWKLPLLNLSSPSQDLSQFCELTKLSTWESHCDTAWGLQSSTWANAYSWNQPQGHEKTVFLLLPCQTPWKGDNLLMGREKWFFSLLPLFLQLHGLQYPL